MRGTGWPSGRTGRTRCPRPSRSCQAPGRPTARYRSLGTTTTGQCACPTTWLLTEPIIRLASGVPGPSRHSN